MPGQPCLHAPIPRPSDPACLIPLPSASIPDFFFSPCFPFLFLFLPGSYNQISLKSPVLLESELEAVCGNSALSAQTFTLHYTSGSPTAMQDALTELCKKVGGWLGDLVVAGAALSGWG
jgi:hypothetical protein